MARPGDGGSYPPIRCFAGPSLLRRSSRMCPTNHQLTGILAGGAAFLWKYWRNRCQESRARYLHVAVEVYGSTESGFLLIRSSNRNLVPVFLAAHRRCCSDRAGLNTIERYTCERN